MTSSIMFSNFSVHRLIEVSTHLDCVMHTSQTRYGSIYSAWHVVIMKPTVLGTMNISQGRARGEVLLWQIHRG
jgi:hypothetical protein